jgi:hypothetical protein
MGAYEEQLRQAQVSALLASKRCTEMEMEMQQQGQLGEFDFYGN